MKLRVLIAIAAIPAITTVGYAQTPTPTPAQEPSATTTPAPDATTTTTTTQTTTNAPKWYQRQQNEWRASKLIGSKVKNNADETIGDINEILLTSDGSAAAAIIGVGGFLGYGRTRSRRAVQVSTAHTRPEWQRRREARYDEGCSEERSGLDVAELVTQHFSRAKETVERPQFSAARPDAFLK